MDGKKELKTLAMEKCPFLKGVWTMCMEGFGSYMRELRKEKAMTQQELAEKLHVSVSAVSKWERGLCYPELTKMEDLSELFGIPVTDLIHCRTSSIGSETNHSESMAPMVNGMRAEETKLESQMSQTSEQKTSETTFLLHPSKLTEEERRQYNREYHRLQEEERRRSRRIWGLALIPDTILTVAGYYLWPAIKAWFDTYMIPGNHFMAVDQPLSPGNQGIISHAPGMFHGPSEIYYILGFIAVLFIGAIGIVGVLTPETYWNIQRITWGASEEEAPNHFILLTRIGGLILWALCVILVLMLVTMA